MVLTDWLCGIRTRITNSFRRRRTRVRRDPLGRHYFVADVLEERALLAAAVDDSFSVQKNTATLLTVLANDTGTNRQMYSVTQPAHGTTEIRPDVPSWIWQEWQSWGQYEYTTFGSYYEDNSYGSQSSLVWGVRYTPTTNYLGSDTFNYTISYSGGQSTAAVSITVTPPPNQKATVALQNLVGSLSQTTSTTNRVKLADIVVTDDGQGTNTLGLTGTDASLLEIYDGDLYLRSGTTLDAASNPQLTVTVTVDDTTISGSPDNSVAATVNVFAPADAQNDSVSTPKNQAAFVNVLANDTGSTRQLVSLTQPAHGTAEIRPDVPGWMWQEWISWGQYDYSTFGAWYQDYYYGDPSTLVWGARYSPTTNYVGSDSFTYTISDGTTQDTATVSVTVTPPGNQKATVTLQNLVGTLSQATNTTNRVKLADIVVTDDGQGTNTLGLTGADASLLEIYDGDLYLRSGTALDYASNPQLTVTVTVDDTTISGSPDNSVAATINVIAPADAQNDSVTTLKNQASFFNVLANDTGTTRQLVSVTQPAHGTAEIRPDVSTSIWQQWVNNGQYDYDTFSQWYQDYYGNPSSLVWGVRYTPTTNYVGSDSFTYTISDGAGQDTATVSVTVTPPPNQKATLALQNVVTPLPEATSTTNRVKLADIVVSDDGLGTNTLALTGADAALLEIYDGDLYLRAGTKLDYSSNPQLNATVTVDDTTISGSPDGSIVATINIANNNLLPANLTTPEDTPLDLTGARAIVLGNVPSGQLSVTFSVADGTLQVQGSTSSLASFSGNGTALLQLSGTRANVNAAVSTLRFTPHANFNGVASISITTLELNPASGPGWTDVDALAIAVSPVGDAPGITAPSTISANEDETVHLIGANGIAISEVGSTSRLSVLLAVEHGRLSILGDTSDLEEIFGNGSASVQLLGTAQAIDAALLSLDFNPDQNFAGTATLQITASDSENSGMEDPLVSSSTVSIVLAARNDAPVNQVIASRRTTSNTPLVFTGYSAISIGDVDSGEADVRVTLNAAHGTLAVGGNVSGLTSQSGGGTATVVLTGDVAAINAALTTLTFTPTASFIGQAALLVTTSDLGGTGAGGTQTDIDEIRIRVDQNWDQPDDPPAAPPNGVSPTQAAGTYQSAVAAAAAAFEAAMASASATHDTLTTGAADTRAAALAAALAAFQSAATGAETTNQSATTAANSALQTALGSFASSFSTISFAGFTWPDPPPELQVTLQGSEPTAEPGWSGPTFDVEANAGYQSALAALTATRASASTQAEQVYQQSLASAAATYDDALEDAADERDAALDAATAAFQQAWQQANPFDDDWTAALASYATALQAALAQRTSALVAAGSAYQSAQTSAYNTYLAGMQGNATQQIEATYQYALVTADLSATQVTAIETAQNVFDRAMQQHELSVAAVQAQRTNWSSYNQNTATLTRALAQATAEETYQHKLALAREVRSKAEAQAVETRSLVMSAAVATFQAGAANARVAAVTAWANAQGTPWATYQKDRAVREATYDQAVATAYQALSAGLAEANLASENALAEATRGKADDYATAVRVRDTTRASLASAEANSRIEAREARRSRDAQAAATRDETIANAYLDYITEIIEARKVSGKAAAAASREFSLTANSLWGSYYVSAISWASYQAGMAAANVELRHKGADAWFPFATASFEAQADYQNVTKSTYRGYVLELGASNVEFQAATNAATVMHVAGTALADAKYADDLSAADLAFALDVAAADHTWANTSADLHYELQLDFADAERDQAIALAGDHRTFAQNVMTAYVNAMAAWSASVAAATPEWGQYYLDLAHAEQTRSAAAENAQVAFTTAQALSVNATNSAIAIATWMWDVDAADRDRDFAVAEANADRTRDAQKNYAMFDAVAQVGGHTYTSGLTAEFAADFVAAFASAQVPGLDPTDISQKQVQQNALYASFQDTVQNAARQRTRAEIQALYEYQKDQIDSAGYVARLAESYAVYKQIYIDALATYRRGLANLNVAPRPVALAPVDETPELTYLETVRLNAAGRLIDADRDYRLSLAAAQRTDARNNATSQLDYDLGMATIERDAEIARAASQKALDIAAAQAQADYEHSADAAGAAFQVTAWTRIRNQRQAAASATPSAINSFYAAYAQLRLNWVVAATAAQTLLVGQSSALDLQAASTLGELVRARDAGLASAQATYDSAVATAAFDNEFDLADAEYAREAGVQGEGGDARDEADYRKQVAYHSTVYDHLTNATKVRYESLLAAARYGELVNAIDASHDYQSGEITLGGYNESAGVAATKRQDAVVAARIDYVETTGRFYVGYISALAGRDAAFAGALATNEFDHTVDVQTTDDAYSVAERTAGSILRTAEALAARNYAVGESTARQTVQSGKLAAAVTYQQSLVDDRVEIAEDVAHAEVDYHVAVAQAALAQGAGSGAFNTSVLSSKVAWLQGLRSGYVDLVGTVALAEAQFDLAGAQLDQTYQNALLTADAAATLAAATAQQTRTLADGAADDISAAATDAAFASFNVQMAALNKSATIDSAAIRADHAVSVAKARQRYDVGLARATRDNQSAFSSAQTALTANLAAQTADADVEQAASLGDVAVGWVDHATTLAVTYNSATGAAQNTHAASSAAALVAEATALANAGFTRAIAVGAATSNKWVGAALAAESRDYTKAVAQSDFFLAQEQSNSLVAASFVGQFRQQASIASLTLLNDNGTSSTDRVTTDPTLTGTVDLHGLSNFARVEFDFDGNGTVDGAAYTNLSGQFTFTPGAALQVGAATIRARASIDGTVSAWTSLSITLADDGINPAISSLTVSGLDQGVASSSVLQGTIVATGSLSGVTIQFDTNGDGTSDGQTTTDSSGGFSFTASGLPEGYTVVAARVSGGQWNRLGFVHTSNVAAAHGIQGWGEFVIDRAAAKYVWAQTTATQSNALAAQSADARVAYAELVATDYVTMVSATATANRTYSLAVANSTAAEIVAAADADVDYRNALAPAERDYRIAVAQIVRQHEIDVAESRRIPNQQWQLQEDAHERRDDALADVTATYASFEGALAVTRAGALAALRNVQGSAVATAGMARSTTAATAAQTFAAAQADANYDLKIDVAAAERDFALLSATGLRDEMNDLSADSPSPWATRESSLAQAERTRSQTISSAAYSEATADAGAERTFADVSAMAGVDFALVIASADSTQYVATINAGSTYLQSVAITRARLSYDANYDAPLILMIGDVPLMLDGQAWAHINEDGSLSTVWSLPYLGDTGAWSYGVLDYGVYDQWAGFYGDYEYYIDMGYATLGDLFYVGYFGYYPAYYAYYGTAYFGGYYSLGFGPYNYNYEDYVGYYGIYGGYGYGWWGGYSSWTWAQGTSVGTLSYAGVNELTAPVSGLNTGSTTYDLSAGDQVDAYLSTQAPALEAVEPPALPAVVDQVTKQAAQQAFEVAIVEPAAGHARMAQMKQLQAENVSLKTLENVLGVAEMELSGVKGFAIGFLKDGLFGTVSDGWSLVTGTWSALGAVGGFIGDTTMSYITGNWEGSQAQKLGETARTAASQVMWLGNELVSFVNSHPQAVQYLMNGNVEGLRGLAAQALLSPEGQTLLMTTSRQVQAIAAAIENKVVTMPTEQKAELLGRVAGFFVYQAVEGLVTASAATAAKAGKISAALYKFQDIVDNFPGLQWADETGQVRAAVKTALARLADDVAFLLKTNICFVAGTKVHTVEGLKSIEDIRPGDMVLTRAESAGSDDVSPVYMPVLQAFITHPDTLYHVSLRTEGGEEETLSTTAGHPFYVSDKACFVEACELNTGDTLFLPEGRTAAVTGIRIERAEPGTSFTTYNFAVADTHTYFAGKAGVWVHNISNNPCKLLATEYLRDINNRVPPEQALAKMAKRADEMLVNHDIVDHAERTRHLREAIREAGLPDNTPIPASVVAEGSLARGRKARELLAAALGPDDYPVQAEAHHIFGVNEFNTELGRRLQLWNIDLNGKDNGVWLPKYDYPGRKASLHNGRPLGDYTKEVLRRLSEADTREEALAILNRIRDDLLNGDLRINGAK